MKGKLTKTLQSLLFGGALALSSCYVEKHCDPQIIYVPVSENPKVKITDQEKINIKDYEIKVGDQAKIYDKGWVDVVNSVPIIRGPKNNSWQFKYGDSCIIQRGRDIEVLGFTKDKVLVEYSGAGFTEGTFCPDEIQFLLTPEEFISQKIGENKN